MAQFTFTLRGSTEPQSETVLDNEEYSEKQVREIGTINLAGSHAVQVNDGDDAVLKFRDGTVLRLKKYVLILKEDPANAPKIEGLEAVADDGTIVSEDSLLEDRNRDHPLAAELSKPETVLGDAPTSTAPPVFSVAPPVFGLPTPPHPVEIQPLPRVIEEPPKFPVDSSRIIGIPDTFNASGLVTGEGGLLFRNSDGTTRYAFDINPNDRATSDRPVFVYTLQSLSHTLPRDVANSVTEKHFFDTASVLNTFTQRNASQAILDIIAQETGKPRQGAGWLEVDGDHGTLFVGKVTGALLYAVKDTPEEKLIQTTLAQDEFVRDSFSYKASDGTFSSNEIPLSIRISGVNDHLINAFDDNVNHVAAVADLSKGLSGPAGMAVEQGSAQAAVNLDSTTAPGTTPTHLAGSLLSGWTDADHTPNPAEGGATRAGTFQYTIFAKNVPDTFSVSATGLPKGTAEILPNDVARPGVPASPFIEQGQVFTGSPAADSEHITLRGRYGMLDFNTADGTWTYRRNEVPISNPSKAFDEFTVRLEETIEGSDNHRLIEHTLSVPLAGVGETNTTSGALANFNAIANGFAAINVFSVVSDASANADQWNTGGVHQSLTVVGKYGTLTVDRLTGNYTYTADETNTDVDKLRHGSTLSETFTYRVADADPGDPNTPFSTTDSTARYYAPEHQLKVSIYGSNDQAVLQAQTQYDATVISTNEENFTGAANHQGMIIGGPSASDAEKALFKAIDPDNTDAELKYTVDQAPHVISTTSANATPSSFSVAGSLLYTTNAAGTQVTELGLNSTVTQEQILGGHFGFDVKASTFQSLGVGESATVQFTMSLRDTGEDGSQAVTRTVTVVVDGVNDAPVVESITPHDVHNPVVPSDSFSVSVSENLDASVTIGTITATDVDNNDHAANSPTLTGGSYSITGGADQALFTIDSTSGALKFDATKFASTNNSPDYENPLDAGHNNIYDVRVTATDSHGATGSQDFQIHVGNLNDSPPHITSADTKAARENSTDVMTVTATDPDGTLNPLHYTIATGVAAGADAAKFQIDETTGQLSFINAPDFEAHASAANNNRYFVGVTVSDGTYSETQQIEVDVRNVREVKPSIDGGPLALVSVNENQTDAYTPTLTDPDATESPSLTYNITGGLDADKFNIDHDTGHLTFKTAPDFENPQGGLLNNSNDYTVTIEVSDTNLKSDQQTVVVHVNDVSDIPPTITGGATRVVSVAENVLTTSTIATVQTTDPDSGAPVFSISGGADGSKFDIDQAGHLTFNTSPDFENPQGGISHNTNAYEVKVLATDSTGMTDEQTITVNVTNLNEPPAFTSFGGAATANVSVADNTTQTVATFAATDPEGHAVTYSLSGSDANLFDLTSGVLTFKAPPSFANPQDTGTNNIYDVTVTAEDGAPSHLIATQSLTVTVQDSATPPIVLDLSGNGLKFTGLSAVTTPTMDMNRDGVLDRMATVGAGTAFLAYDMGGDGLINQRSEIAFVDHAPGATSDLEALRQSFDTNHDHLLNRHDAAWKSLGVWSDFNNDGTLEASEFETLAHAGIKSINLEGHGESQVIADGVRINSTIEFTKADGSLGTGADVTLSYGAGTPSAHADHPTAVAASGSTTSHPASGSPADHANAAPAPAAADSQEVQPAHHHQHLADETHSPAAHEQPAPAPAPIMPEDSHAQANLHSPSGAGDTHPIHDLAGLMHGGGHFDLFEHLGNAGQAGSAAPLHGDHGHHALPPADEVLSSAQGSADSALQLLDASHLSDHSPSIMSTSHAHADTHAHVSAVASAGGGGGGGHHHSGHAAHAHHGAGGSGAHDHGAADGLAHAGAMHVAKHDDLHLHADAPAAVA